jgi:hypothetical protein
MAPSPVVATATGVELTVHVQPNAARTEPAGLYGDALKLRVAAVPVDGAANTALIEFVAKRLRVPRASVRLLRGASNRRKRLAIDGVSEAAVRQVFGLPGDRLAPGMETA